MTNSNRQPQQSRKPLTLGEIDELEKTLPGDLGADNQKGWDGVHRLLETARAALKVVVAAKAFEKEIDEAMNSYGNRTLGGLSGELKRINDAEFRATIYLHRKYDEVIKKLAPFIEEEKK